MVVRVTIYDSGIDMVFAPGQDVWKFMTGLGTAHLNAAIAFAPSRTNHLRASHYPAPIMTPHRRGWRYTIRNDAAYAEYVHRGTTGPIMAHGGYLWVPTVRGSGWPRHLARSVAGQTANPWIDKAWDFVNPF
jgi:hypothetical protein